MSVTKRLRYEILRRDNHACRYCGAAAPEARLTVDHVIPVALGGTDEPSNLVAACVDCNSGKSATPPDAPLVDEAKADAMRFALALRDAQARAMFAHRMQQETRSAFLEVWDTYDAFKKLLPPDWTMSLEQFLNAGLPLELILDSIDVAWARPGIPGRDRWRYLCGICWKRIASIRDDAMQKFASGEDDS